MFKIRESLESSRNTISQPPSLVLAIVGKLRESQKFKRESKLKVANMAVLLGLFQILVSMPSAQALSLRLIPSSQSALEGNEVTVAVEVSGVEKLSPSPSLAGFDLSVSFNPTILAFQALSFGSFLAPSSEDFEGAAIPGLVSFSQVSSADEDTLKATQPDSFILANLTFQAIAPGTSQLDLSVNPDGLIDGQLNFLSVMGTPPGTEITVERNEIAVPEPTASLPVLGLALALGIGIKRRNPVN